MSTFDYPDFGRLDQWVTDPLVHDVLANVAGVLKTYGPFYVAPYESLEFFIQNGNGVGNMTLTIAFYQDKAMSTQLAVYQYYGAALSIDDSVPVQGAWVTFSCGFSAAGAQVNATIIPQRGFTPGPRFQGGKVMWGINALNIGAGATLSNVLQPVTTGRAIFTIATTATLWAATISAVDGFGSVGVIAALSNGSGGAYQTVEFALPPDVCTVNVTNLDAAGKLFYGAVVPALR